MTTAFFNPALHPRGADGMFTETHHAESGIPLGPSAAAALDLDYIRGIAEDITIAAGPHRIEPGNTDAEDEAHWQAYKAANERLKEFGGADRAAIAVGEMVAARAEAIAGITVNEIRSAYFIRIDEAAERSKQATETWNARAQGVWNNELYEEMQAARAAYSNALDGRDADTKADMRRLADGYLAALEEVRPMGGELNLHPDSDKKAVSLFKDASQFYPTDWLEASNSRNQLLRHYVKKRGHYQDMFHHQVKAQVPVVVTTVHPNPEAAMAPNPKYDWEPTGQTRFGHYRDNDTGQYTYGDYTEYKSIDQEVIYPGRGFRAKKDGTPWGKDWEQWTHPSTGEVYWRRPRTRQQTVSSEKMSEIRLGGRKESYMEGRDVDASTATHELGHRFQYSVGSLNDLERAFLVRRTSIPSAHFPGESERQALEPVYGKSRKELCRPDHFANRYMGKEYEIVTMGMESLFTGTNGGLIGVGRSDPDREFRDFILGAVATAGR